MKRYKNVSNYLATLILGLVFTACSDSSERIVTILHTNDTHSQVEPLEAGKRDALCGGYALRMGIVTQEREKNPDLILLDAGDFSQGTPYFNFYHGRIEVDALNRMGYDAVTLGNHEFDYGVDTLNYNVQGTALEDIVKPYIILRRSGVKIGIFGLGVNPQGLISQKNFTPIQYLDPISVAQEMATTLKKKHCDLVICLSHLGTDIKTPQQTVSHIQLAQTTRDIDIIVGGHTHKILTNYYVENLDGDSVLLAQMGKSGARIGKIEVEMTE